MKKSDASAAHADSGELGFPDWSGMDDSSSRISAEDAFRLCEEYAAQFPGARRNWRSQRPEKCNVEFTL
jgi:hypothetical protein